MWNFSGKMLLLCYQIFRLHFLVGLGLIVFVNWLVLILNLYQDFLFKILLHVFYWFQVFCFEESLLWTWNTVFFSLLELIFPFTFCLPLIFCTSSSTFFFCPRKSNTHTRLTEVYKLQAIFPFLRDQLSFRQTFLYTTIQHFYGALPVQSYQLIYTSTYKELFYSASLILQLV